MKIAVRCLYYKPVTPNFLIVDLPENEWKIFLWRPDCRIDMIRPYIRHPEPSIREISWIPLEGMPEDAMSELVEGVANGLYKNDKKHFHGTQDNQQ